MPLFYYKAIDSKGKTREGETISDQKQELIRKLQSEGYMVTAIEERKLVLLRKQREEVALFTRLLATMLKAGLPLTEAITDIIAQVKDRDLKKSLYQVLEAVLKGQALHEGLRYAPAYFPPLYVHMVKAGESSSLLVEALSRLAKFYEKEQALRQKVRSALTYPAILVVVSIILVSFIMVGFVPRFVSIFKGMDVPLPLPTRILLFFSTNFFWFVLAFLAAAGLVLAMGIVYSSTIWGRKVIDRFKITIPLFGELQLKSALSRYLRTLGTLYATGVPIVEALQLSREVLDNAYLQEKFSFIEEEVLKGEALAENLKETGLFASPVIRFAATGEKTGELPAMLEHGANFYDLEVETAIERLSIVLEPFFLIVMGGIVALIMLSTLLPMFQLIKTLRQ